MANLVLMRHRFWDNDGSLLSGGKVYIYEVGTTTLKNSYTDADAGTPNANPVILDSKGEADIWINGAFKVNVTNSADVQVTGYPVDDINSSSIAIDTNAATSKVTPVDADEIPIADSATSFSLKKLLWSNLKATLLTTWKDTTGAFVGLTLFKVNLKNNANTFTSTLENSNTAARAYVLPDVSGTIALTSDISAVQPNFVKQHFPTF